MPRRPRNADHAPPPKHHCPCTAAHAPPPTLLHMPLPPTPPNSHCASHTIASAALRALARAASRSHAVAAIFAQHCIRRVHAHAHENTHMHTHAHAHESMHMHTHAHAHGHEHTNAWVNVRRRWRSLDESSEPHANAATAICDLLSADAVHRGQRRCDGRRMRGRAHPCGSS